jgi:hypothetical protein
VAFGPRAGFEVALGDAMSLRVHADLLADVVRPAVTLNGAIWTMPEVGAAFAGGVAYRFP